MLSTYSRKWGFLGSAAGAQGLSEGTSTIIHGRRQGQWRAQGSDQLDVSLLVEEDVAARYGRVLILNVAAFAKLFPLSPGIHDAVYDIEYFGLRELGVVLGPRHYLIPKRGHVISGIRYLQYGKCAPSGQGTSWEWGY